MTELPGGMPKKGERDEVTAARELQEESGVKVSPEDLKLLATLHRDPARSVNLVVPVYGAEIAPDAPTAAPTLDEPGEHIEGAFWLPFDNLQESIARGEQTDAILVATVGILAVRQTLAR